MSFRLANIAGMQKVILLISMAILSSNAYCQDPEFSQFYANPIYTNPSFAGSSNVGRIVLNSRVQWPQIAGTFVTSSTSYDEHFDVINGGFGAMINYDEQGVGTLRTIGVNLMYSYQIPLTRKLTMRAAIQGGIIQKSLDFSKLNWYDQVVLTRGFINPPQEFVYTGDNTNLDPVITITNFAAGLVFYSKNFYGGFAAHNLFEPQQNFFKAVGGVDDPKNVIPRRYTGHVGLVIPLITSRSEKRTVNLYPNVVIMQQRQFNQVNLGAYISKGSWVGGMYFRQNTINSDAVIFLFGIRTPKVKLGYSYDITLSEARPGAVNSHEVSAAVELRKHVRRKTIRPVRCPDF